MERERFYFGNAKEETAKELIKIGDWLTHGVSRGEEWIVFADTIAVNEYTSLLVDTEMGIVLRDLERMHSAKGEMKVKEIAETLEQIVRDADENTKNKVNEDKLVGKLVYEMNETAMREVALHVVGDLRHYPVRYHVRFPVSGIEREDAAEVITKAGLGANSAMWISETETGTSRVEVDVENKEECVKNLCRSLEERGVKVEVWCARKTYPVKFELDDIKIVDSVELKETLLFYKIKDPSKIGGTTVS
jgi:hypothetical protein